MSSPRTEYYFFKIYPCCSAQTLQTTPVNTSTGLLLLGFILPEQSLYPRAGFGQRGSSRRSRGGGHSAGSARAPPPLRSFPVPAAGIHPHPARRRGRTLTSPGLPDLGAQHAPGWALPAASAPGPGRRPAHPRRRSSPGSGATPHAGLNKP